jgi:uncharacterized protein YybS (DUF2232 family)
VATRDYEQPEISSIVTAVLLTALALILPGLQWSLFGWLHLFLPLLAFFLFGRYGRYSGKRLLLTGMAIALIANIFLGNVDLFIFSCASLFAGSILQRSAERGDSPALSGLQGFLALAGSWWLVMLGVSVGSEVSVYGQFLQTLDQGITETVNYYRQSDSLSVDTLLVMETTLAQMKVIVPLVMPGVLGSLVLLIVWLTMVLGNGLMVKTNGYSAWPSYRNWQLPERLVWLVIVMGVLATLPIRPLRLIGINCIILLSIIYCFQGLSITVYFMNKWNVPLLLRSFFYVMIVFQSLGTVILLLFGIADIWLDFRKLKSKALTDTK